MVAGQGADTLDGGAGVDTADFSPATANLALDLAAGTEGATGSVVSGFEAALGGSGNDSIAGDATGNWLDGRDGGDTVRGAGGADTLIGGVGNNLLDGGDGEDVAFYGWAGAGVLVDLGQGTASNGAGTDTIAGVEHASGTAFADTIRGGAGANFLHGGAGGDDLSGGAGSDTLLAGQGADTLDGGDGLDIVDFAVAAAGARASLGLGVETGTGAVLLSVEGMVGTGFGDYLDGGGTANWIDGRAGNDTIHGFESQDTLMGGLGQNTIDGGVGDDVLRYDWMAGPVSVDLAAGTAVGAGFSDFLTGIEAVTGTTANDTVRGGSEDNYLQAGLGDDLVAGGVGDDTIASGAGRDTLDGGEGLDLVDFGAAASAVFVDLARGIEASTGTVLASIEAAIGSNLNDVLTGDSAANYLAAGAGNDTLTGGRGNDTLIGGAGADRIGFDDGDGYDAVFGFQTGLDVIDATAYNSADPSYAPNIFEFGGDLVIQFQNGDTLYLVGTSLDTFNAATDLRL